ncbi:MAG: hypothetical protein AAF561_14460 [Planctomycetota bacterium]
MKWFAVLVTLLASVASAQTTEPATRPAQTVEGGERPPIPVYDSMGHRGKPIAGALGLAPMRQIITLHEDHPERWAELIDDAAVRGLPIMSNMHEAEPERWAEFVQLARKRQPLVEVGVYNQITRDYWVMGGLWGAVAKRRETTPKTLDELRAFYLSGKTLWGMPEVWALAESSQRFAITGWDDEANRQPPVGDVRRDSHLGRYLAWQAELGDFIWHEDRRVLDMTYLPVSVYSFYPDATPERLYLYAADVLASHKAWLRGTDIPVVAVMMATHHNTEQMLTAEQATVIATAARDVGCAGIILWGGPSVWTAEHNFFVRDVLGAARRAD